jgi:hypothetical protein
MGKWIRRHRMTTVIVLFVIVTIVQSLAFNNRQVDQMAQAYNAVPENVRRTVQGLTRLTYGQHLLPTR